MTAALIFLAIWAALIVVAFAFSLGRTAANADRRIERLDFPRPAPSPPAGQSARTGDPEPAPSPRVHGSPAAVHGRRGR